MSGSDPLRSIGFHHVEEVMGMTVSIDVRDDQVTEAMVGEVVAWLHHVDETFSTHKPESPISAMGRGEVSYADASDEIKDVLRLCQSMFLLTNGVFNVFEVPAPNGTRFDPSGLVKGWSIERAAAILERRGCHNFCLNAGGDAALRGRPTSDTHWRIGIRHPDDKGKLATVVEARTGLAVATSASYERGAHIVDPTTGHAVTQLASATVVGPDLTTADAYATALYVKGQPGLKWLEAQDDYDGYVITREGTTHWTQSFSAYKVV